MKYEKKMNSEGSPKPKPRAPPVVGKKPAVALKPKLNVNVSRNTADGNDGSNSSQRSRAPPPRPRRPAAGPPAQPPVAKPPAPLSGPPKPPRSPASTLAPGLSFPPQSGDNLGSPADGANCQEKQNDIGSAGQSPKTSVQELVNKLSRENVCVDQTRPVPRKRTPETKEANSQGPGADSVKVCSDSLAFDSARNTEETTPHVPPRHKRKSHSPLNDIRNVACNKNAISEIKKRFEDSSLELEKSTEPSVSENLFPPVVQRKLPNKPPKPPKPFLRSKSTENLGHIDDEPISSTRPIASKLDKALRRRSRSLGDLVGELQSENNDSLASEGLASVLKRLSLVQEECISKEADGDICNIPKEDSTLESLLESSHDNSIDISSEDGVHTDTITPLEEQGLTQYSTERAGLHSLPVSNSGLPSCNIGSCALEPNNNASDIISTSLGKKNTEAENSKGQPSPRARGAKAPVNGKDRQPAISALLPATSDSVLEQDTTRLRAGSVPVIPLFTPDHPPAKPRSDSQSSSSSEGRKSHGTGSFLQKGSKLLSQFKHRVSRKSSSSSEQCSKTSSTFYCDVGETGDQFVGESDPRLSMVSVFSDPGSSEYRMSVIGQLPTHVPASQPTLPTPQSEPNATSPEQMVSKTVYPVTTPGKNTQNSDQGKGEKPPVMAKPKRPTRPAPPPPIALRRMREGALPSNEKSEKEVEAKVNDNTRASFTEQTRPDKESSWGSLKDDKRSSRGSNKSDRSNKTRKRSAGHKSGPKYDSMGYLKPRSNSAGDAEEGHCYADIDSSDDERKMRSNSDASVQSGVSSHIYEPIGVDAQHGPDTEIYQDISEDSEDESERRITMSPETSVVSPPVPPPRNKRMQSLFPSQFGEITSSHATSPGDGALATADGHMEDEYTLPDSDQEDEYTIHDPDKETSDEDSYQVTPRKRSKSGRHSLRECEYIDMTGKTFSRENLLAAIDEQLGCVTSDNATSDNATSDPASSSDEDDAPDGQEAEGSAENGKPAPKKNKIFCIAEEIMSSERVFVDVLALLNQDFRHAVDEATAELDAPVIPASQLNLILNNLPQMHRFSQDLLSDLEQRIEHWDEDPRVADIFVRKGPFLKLYTSYIKDFNSTMQAFEEACKKHPQFLEVVKKFQMSDRCARLALGHYMLKPIQRIPQYKMLLSTYLDKLPPDSPDLDDTKDALRIVSEVADHANEAMREGDNQRELLQVQERLVGGEFVAVQPGRTMVREGDLMKLSRKEMQPRRFFLFSDVLLHTTPMTIGAYKINNKLSLAGMKVVKPVQEDFQNEFSILSVQRSFTLAASSPQERDDWITDLTNTIKEFTLKRTTFKRQVNQLPDLPEQAEDFELGRTAPVWIPDTRVTMCMLCTSEFTITFRRHHCRACGKVVCGPCSEYKAPLQYLKNKPNRVCSDCFEVLEKEFEEQEGTDSPPRSPGGSPINLRDHFVNKGLRKSGGKYKRRPAVLKEVSATDGEADLSGYLQQHVKGKKWKKLWFVVKDKVLYTYGASEDMAALESLPLLGYEIATFTESYEGVEPTLLLQITHKGRPPTILKTETSMAAEKWIQVLRDSTVP